MLSWHEGFGLTGWEAIAAEVPLIISRHSGLFELVSDYLHGAGIGCLNVVDIQGQRGGAGEDNFTPDDLKQVSNAILSISANLGHHRDNARALKRLLIERFGCTWRDVASRFLDTLPEPEPAATVDVQNPKTSNSPVADALRDSGVRGENTSDAQYGPFHRLASPTQTDEMASLQEAEGRIYGSSGRFTLGPAVQAYQGPLPPNAVGVEFTTSVPPSLKTDFHATWYRSQNGVPISTRRGEDYFAVPVTITKRVALSFGIDAVLNNPLIEVVDRHDDMGSYAVRIGGLDTIVFIELGRFRTQEITKFGLNRSAVAGAPVSFCGLIASLWNSAIISLRLTGPSAGR